MSEKIEVKSGQLKAEKHNKSEDIIRHDISCNIKMTHSSEQLFFEKKESKIGVKETNSHTNLPA